MPLPIPELRTARPVDAMYQGKALRLQQALGEKELEQADDKLDIKKRQVAVDEGVLEQRVKEYTAQVGEAQALRESQHILAITSLSSEAGSPEAALEVANREMPKFIASLPDGESKKKLMEMASNGFDASELAILNRTAEVTLGLYGKSGSAFRPLTPEEKEAFGIPQESFAQVGADGKISIDDPPRDTPLVTVNPGEREADKAFGKGVGERANDRITQAESTLASDASLERAKLALSRGAQTGAWEGPVLELKSIGSTLFGIEFSESDEEAEVIRKLGNEAALRLRNPESGMGLTGNTSNKDLQFLKDSVFGLQRTEGGNIKIIDYMMRMNKLKRDLASEQSRIIASNDGTVPSNLDTQLMAYVDTYQIFTEDERILIENIAANSKSVVDRVGEAAIGDDGKETYDDGTTVTWE